MGVFCKPKQNTPSPQELQLLMEDLETLNRTKTEYHPPLELELLMEDFVWWTCLWRLPLYPPRMPSRFLCLENGTLDCKINK